MGVIVRANFRKPRGRDVLLNEWEKALWRAAWFPSLWTWTAAAAVWFELTREHGGAAEVLVFSTERRKKHG
jgi:hypothetical protein